MKILAIILVGFGFACLAKSFFSAQRICRMMQQNKPGWKSLCGLMFFFMVGYAVFAAMLLIRTTTIADMLVAAVFGGGGLFVALVVRMSKFNIEDIKRVAALERHRALYDEVTNLPNRTLLHEHIDLTTLSAEKQQISIAVILVDLVRFRDINNTLGHYYGDYLLQLIVPRLKACVGDNDMVSRLGGDEFVLIKTGIGNDEARDIAKQIFSRMEEPFRIEGQELKVDVTIGIAMYPQHGIESESLLQHAHVAKDIAKKAGNSIAFYEVGKDKYNWDRLMLIGELREAIKRDQLVLHYQPKYTLRDGQVKGVEALVRWQHPESEQLIPPDDFVSIAEQAGLINDLTRWVLNKAFSQKAAWKAAGLDLVVSVNLSIKNLHDLEFPAQVKELLEKWRIDPAGIILEITESSMILDPERTYVVITRLHELGLYLSIDDFGTGYSSLSYLKQLPAAELKVDKSFVRDMVNNENDQVIVRTTIDLAKNMGMQVVAEGVEDAAVLGLLHKLGCDTVQGYHLCRPLQPEALFNMLTGKK